MAVEAELIGQSAMWLEQLAATWRVTASAMLVELPHGPINTPLPVKIDTHTHHILEILLVNLPFLVY
jgi:hypothetical protein